MLPRLRLATVALSEISLCVFVGAAALLYVMPCR